MAGIVDDAVRKQVRPRARDVCEYCRLMQAAQPRARFHIEHVRPRQHQGSDDLDNLCLAYGHYNRFKCPKLASIDPVTEKFTPLFNPRVDLWDAHFALSEHRILGTSPIGRVTVSLLNMNAADRVQLRVELSHEGAPEIG